MSQRSAADVLQAMVKLFNGADITRVNDHVGPSYVDHQGLGGVPLRGPEGFAEVVHAARAVYERLDVEVVDMIEGDDRVAARLAWFGALPSGETVNRETIEIVRVSHGRAVEHWGGRC